MTNFLCIDIGGTRIKSAILKNNISLADFKTIKVNAIKSLGWLNSSLPELLSKNHPDSIIQQCGYMDQYEIISISVPAIVINDGTEISGHHIETRGIPKDLKHAFENQAKCQVLLINDAVSWLKGALNYCKLHSIHIKFPCLLLSFGTGVAMGYSKGPNCIENIELSNCGNYFTRVSRESKQPNSKGWQVHAYLGESYFHSLKNADKDITFQEIRASFTKRVHAFLLDIRDKAIVDFLEVQTIFIGGGNAVYIDHKALKYRLQKDIFLLTSDNLKINPDIIPLLGLINNTFNR